MRLACWNDPSGRVVARALQERGTFLFMAIRGTEGLSAEQIHTELSQGAKFVVFEYCISVIVITLRRSSEVHFVRPGQSTLADAMPYILLSLAFGWWGFPFGLIYTPWTIITNLQGGKDVTSQVFR